MTEYTEMWRNLGLNLENHAGLLEVLTEGYKKRLLEQSLGKMIHIASLPEMTGALGAALYAEQEML